MQVNPIGIQSYQQVTQRENSPASQAEGKDKSQKSPSKVTITPHDELAGSKMAVKAPRGTYADALTDVEKKALDLLFSRFRGSGRFGPGYAAGTATDDDARLVGNMVDVKV